jgi:hypothetical protein
MMADVSNDENCPHCPDGHKPPDRQPWSAWITEDRDGDGQPTTIHVARSNGAHVAESDAQWIRERLNDRVGREVEPKPRKPVMVGTGMPATSHLEAFGESLRDAFGAGISELGRQRTGLPVDFQVQRTTDANEMFDGPRNALFLHRAEDDCRPEMLPAAEPVVPASARFATDGDRKSFLAMFGDSLDDWFTPEFAAFVRTGPQPVVPRERAVNRDDADGDT